MKIIIFKSKKITDLSKTKSYKRKRWNFIEMPSLKQNNKYKLKNVEDKIEKFRKLRNKPKRKKWFGGSHTHNNFGEYVHQGHQPFLLRQHKGQHS